MRYARSSFEFIAAQDSPNWETAFAYAVLSHPPFAS